MPQHIIPIKRSKRGKLMKISKRFRGSKKKGRFQRFGPPMQEKQRASNRRKRALNVEEMGLFSKRLF